MTNPFFFEISKHRRLVEKNKNLFQLFIAALEVADDLQQIPTLQKEFILTEVCYSYCAFGTGLFVPSSIELVAQGLYQYCGLEIQLIKKYLLHLKEFLFEEIHVDKKESYFSEEPLESSFAREFIKRIFCTEKEEDIQTGMFVFDHRYCELVRSLSRKKIANFSSVNEDGEALASVEQEKELLRYDSIYNEFVLFLKNLKADPLTLIVSRFESFVHFFKNDFHSYFIYKDQNLEVEEKSKKISAILTLLVPHANKNGVLLFKDTMLTANQIAKALSPKFKSNFFNLQPVQSWIGGSNEIELKGKVKFFLEEALQCGVVFKIPHGKIDYSYGLSESGLKIIKPFHNVLTDSFCSA